MNGARKNRPAGRTTFRHGDLRRALLQAGIELAREGGPRAVVLREATRSAGVAPNAAYRHFSSHRDLLQAVRAAALSSLAVAIEAEMARARRRKCSPAEAARANLRAVGTGYLKFALKDWSFPNRVLNPGSGGGRCRRRKDGQERPESFPTTWVGTGSNGGNRRPFKGEKARGGISCLVCGARPGLPDH
jgi:AcrR family transcriptional regulator